jgi:hypothetical protein
MQKRTKQRKNMPFMPTMPDVDKEPCFKNNPIFSLLRSLFLPLQFLLVFIQKELTKWLTRFLHEG